MTVVIQGCGSPSRHTNCWLRFGAAKTVEMIIVSKAINKANLAFLQYQKTGISLFYDEQAMISLQEIAELNFFFVYCVVIFV